MAGGDPARVGEADGHGGRRAGTHGRALRSSGAVIGGQCRLPGIGAGRRYAGLSSFSADGRPASRSGALLGTTAWTAFQDLIPLLTLVRKGSIIRSAISDNV